MKKKTKRRILIATFFIAGTAMIVVCAISSTAVPVLIPVAAVCLASSFSILKDELKNGNGNSNILYRFQNYRNKKSKDNVEKEFSNDLANTL